MAQNKNKTKPVAAAYSGKQKQASGTDRVKSEKKKRRAQKKEKRKRQKEQQLLRNQQKKQMEEQLAQEDSAAYEELIRRRRQWKKSRRRHSYIVILILLGIAGTILAFRMFLTITNIKVLGESRYDDEELILSSGLNIGDHLYDFDPDLVAQEILDGHIYLEFVRVERVLPTTVEICVTPVMETGVVQGETGFSIISSGGKVLQTGVLYPPAELPIISGLQLSVDQSDQEKMNHLNKRLETLSALNVAMTAAKFTGVTSIDLTDMLNIIIVYQDRVRINLGDSEDLNSKIKRVSNALDEIDPSKQGVIDASIEKKVFFHEENIHPEYEPVIPVVPEVPVNSENGLPEEGAGGENQTGNEQTDVSENSSASSQIPQIPPSPNIP